MEGAAGRIGGGARDPRAGGRGRPALCCRPGVGTCNPSDRDPGAGATRPRAVADGATMDRVAARTRPRTRHHGYGFWLGMCRLRRGSGPEARLDLEPAFALFQQEDDTLGQSARGDRHQRSAHGGMGGLSPSRSLDCIARSATEPSRCCGTVPEIPSWRCAPACSRRSCYRQTYREDIPVPRAAACGSPAPADLDPNYKLLAARGIFIYGAYSGDFVLTDEVASLHRIGVLRARGLGLESCLVCRASWLCLALRGYEVRVKKRDRVVSEGTGDRARAGLRFVEAPIAIYWAWAEEVFGEIADLERELRDRGDTPQSSESLRGGFRQNGNGVSPRCATTTWCRRIAHWAKALSFSEQSGYTLGQVAGHTWPHRDAFEHNDFRGARDALDRRIEAADFQGPLRRYADGMLRAGIALGHNGRRACQNQASAGLGR